MILSTTRWIFIALYIHLYIYNFLKLFTLVRYLCAFFAFVVAGGHNDLSDAAANCKELFMCVGVFVRECSEAERRGLLHWPRPLLDSVPLFELFHFNIGTILFKHADIKSV